MNSKEALIELVKEQQKLVTLISSYKAFDEAHCKSCDEVLNLFKTVNNDLYKLKQYRELFEKIKNSDQTLEYTGDELINYYEEIEND